MFQMTNMRSVWMNQVLSEAENACIVTSRLQDTYDSKHILLPESTSLMNAEMPKISASNMNSLPSFDSNVTVVRAST